MSNFHVCFELHQSLFRHLSWSVLIAINRWLTRSFVINIYGQSDCFYNAGWTEDVRKVIDHIHCQYPEAPLYAVGTSIGANILVCFSFYFFPTCKVVCVFFYLERHQIIISINYLPDEIFIHFIFNLPHGHFASCFIMPMLPGRYW